MTGEPVLIAGLSARALAQSARRAGFVPLVVDCFGDADTLACAAHARVIPARVVDGFTYRPLAAALADLTASSDREPIGLILGTGFEGSPKLVARLEQDYRLLGNSADVIRDANDPQHFFSVLSELGVLHPETHLDLPPDPTDGAWLVKRAGGSGGLHVQNLTADEKAHPRRYYQRKVSGEAISLLGALSPQSAAFALSRQWISPSRKRPYRYGGSVGSIEVDPDLEARLISVCLDVADALGLVGLVSFDFMLDGDEPYLIEVNPRTGATLDVFDDPDGTLFQVHLEAVLGGDPAGLLASAWHPPVACASAYLYADRGSLTVPDVAWPDWTRDHPYPGSTIRRGDPIATVMAVGEDAERVEQLCRERLLILAEMLYGAQAEH